MLNGRASNGATLNYPASNGHVFSGQGSVLGGEKCSRRAGLEREGAINYGNGHVFSGQGSVLGGEQCSR